MRRKVTPRDFRIANGGPDFRVGVAKCPGFPVLKWSDGTVCEPVVAYFGHCAESDTMATSSMKTAAYAIREWLAHLANEGKAWDLADDDLLCGWRESHGDGIASGSVSARRVETKLAAVFAFYKNLPDALPLDGAGRPRERFVGASGSGCRITSEVVETRHGRRQVWSGAKSAERQSPPRPTPDEEQVAGILEWLLYKPEGISTNEGAEIVKGAPALDGERDRMIGRCMAEAGLRAAEVAGLTLRALARSLRRDGIIGRPDEPARVVDDPSYLDEAGSDDVARRNLLDGLKRLGKRKYLFVEITGKGRKVRAAAFPIGLMRDLLVTAIWRVRRERMEKAAGKPGANPPDAVFLSSTRFAALKPGSVSDLVGAAFKETGTPGSSHRLRAYFATKAAFDVWDECFSATGYQFTGALVETALETLRATMGHAKVDMTVRHYLNLAIKRHLGPRATLRRDLMQRAFRTISRHGAAMSAEKADLVAEVIERLASLPDGSEFERYVGFGLEDLFE